MDRLEITITGELLDASKFVPSVAEDVAEVFARAWESKYPGKKVIVSLKAVNGVPVIASAASQDELQARANRPTQEAD